MARALSALSGLSVVSARTIGYYFEHWNTNVFSLSCLTVLILLISGYFYGRLLQHFIKALKDADCTFLGILLILGVFQIFTYFWVSNGTSTDVAYHTMFVLICASPVLCLVTRSDVRPSWKHLVSFAVGIIVAAVLGKASSELNTNNIFFDSIYYLSETLESSTSSRFGGINYYYGTPLAGGFDLFHDFEGYYYFWGMILRFIREYFVNDAVTLTPVYIWGASILYYMSIGSLAVSSVNVLFPKHKWLGVLSALLFISPYYSNYFNTTLAFFGNTFRTVIAGWSVLLIYLYIKKHENLLFIPLAATYYALLSVSSSGFFLAAFLNAGLFFHLAYRKKTGWRDYLGLILSSLPVFHFSILILRQQDYIYWIGMEIRLVALTAALCLIAWVLRKQIASFNSFGRNLLPIAVICLAVLSFLKRNGEFGYSYFFAARSINDMANNFTTHLSNGELIRNVVFYALIALLFANFRREQKFKLFLVYLGVLFINPLVEPAVATYMTSSVYSRVFDLLVNPFMLIFLLANADALLSGIYLNYAGLPAAGLAGVFALTITNLTVPYSKTLTFKDDGYNWENKISDDTLEMYEYINANLIGTERDRPSFLSQDVNLKGYVADIQLPWASCDFREALENEAAFNANYEIMTLMYPDKITDDSLVIDPDGTERQGDYTKLGSLILKYRTDYVILRNTIAVWDSRGWYDKSYAQVVSSGIASVEYENETWVILKVDQAYQIPNKNETRYWVHKLDPSAYAEN